MQIPEKSFELKVCCPSESGQTGLCRGGRGTNGDFGIYGCTQLPKDNNLCLITGQPCPILRVTEPYKTKVY